MKNKTITKEIDKILKVYLSRTIAVNQFGLRAKLLELYSRQREEIEKVIEDILEKPPTKKAIKSLEDFIKNNPEIKEDENLKGFIVHSIDLNLREVEDDILEAIRSK